MSEKRRIFCYTCITCLHFCTPRRTRVTKTWTWMKLGEGFSKWKWKWSSSDNPQGLEGDKSGGERMLQLKRMSIYGRWVPFCKEENFGLIFSWVLDKLDLTHLKNGFHVNCLPFGWLVGSISLVFSHVTSPYVQVWGGSVWWQKILAHRGRRVFDEKRTTWQQAGQKNPDLHSMEK